MITHDLGVVAETADDIVVMYAAKVVEQAPVRSIFNEPRHPYTWGLMGSLPRLDVNVERLVQIPGQPPSLLQPAVGLPLQPALRVRDADLPRAGAAAQRSSAATRRTSRPATSTRRRRQREAAKLVATSRPGRVVVSDRGERATSSSSSTT